MEHCLICDKEFKNCLALQSHICKAHKLKSQEYYDNYIQGNNVCVVCGKPTKYINLQYGYRQHCSNRCGTLDPIIQQKTVDTNLKKYGTKNPNQCDQVKLKKKTTCQDKYGTDYTFQSEKVKTNIKKSNLKRFGTENPFQSNKIKEKIKQTHIKNYGVPHHMMNKDIINKTQQTIITTRKNNNNRSKIELFFEELCRVYNIEYIHDYQDDRYKRSDGYKWKCDYYIPKDDLFIEINFMATHNNHLFDSRSKKDHEWLEHCKTNPKNWVEAKQVTIWAKDDVEKIKVFKDKKLNFIILWNYEEIENFMKVYLNIKKGN